MLSDEENPMQLDQIGPYRIVGRLGKGGMGTVFQAVSVETGEPAAVKLLSANLAEVEGFREASRPKSIRCGSSIIRISSGCSASASRTGSFSMRWSWSAEAASKKN